MTNNNNNYLDQPNSMIGQTAQLSEIAITISRQLQDLIVEEIHHQDGVISFAQFMQMALYSPNLGYYQNSLYTFGEKGDFITAPEMGSLFAASLANAFAVERSNDKQNKLQFLELGAGSGKLACDLINRLLDLNCTVERYFILEPSASLQSLQKELVDAQGLSDYVEWLDCLPNGFNGHIIANEVVDAIPCEKIQKVDQGWQYLGVSIENQQFCWRPFGQVNIAELPHCLQQTENYPYGYQTEIRPLASAWLSSLATSLKEGTITLFDYGYPGAELYHPQRSQGSLQCFSRHSQHDDPLKLIGLQDITAHVDFTQLAETAVRSGLNVEGFTTQSGYLLENGILELADSESKIETYQHSRQIQKLTAPGQMGEVVKVLLMSKGEPTLPQGFKLQDHLYRL